MIVAPIGEDSPRFIERARKQIRDNAYFVQSGDGSGLRLYLNARPTGVTYSFEDIAARSAKRRAENQSDVARQRDAAMKARSGKQ
jgi:hypothetical protein